MSSERDEVKAIYRSFLEIGASESTAVYCTAVRYRRKYPENDHSMAIADVFNILFPDVCRPTLRVVGEEAITPETDETLDPALRADI